MDYELAAKLRDAGFPQGGKGSWIGPPDKIVWRAGDRVYVPSLQELIEACAEQFYRLDRTPLGTFCAFDVRMTYDGAGDTAAEAVARLWLALRANRDASA
jgi:hypothetical protein